MSKDNPSQFTKDDDNTSSTKRFVDDESLGEIVVDDYFQLPPEQRGTTIQNIMFFPLLFAVPLTAEPQLGIFLSTFALAVNIYAYISGDKISYTLAFFSAFIFFLHGLMIGHFIG